jgi:Type I phosphodiesterase / nucleotide pyrophosphatase
MADYVALTGACQGKTANMKPRRSITYAVVAGILLLQWSCGLMFRSLTTGGEEQLKPAATAAVKGGPRVIIFALDGTGHDQLMAAIRSGKAPRIAALLGKERGSGLFEHAYAAPHAVTILPSSTIAAWSAIFTGKPPAMNGVPGDEWFVRETTTFYAPVPVSVLDTLDVTKVVNDNLLGKSLRVPTLFEMLGKKSYVSLLYVHDGATLYTTVAPSSFVDMVGRLISGTMEADDPENSLSAGLDLNSVQKLTEAIDVQGVPDLQVVYFPGIDIFTHVAKDRLEAQVRYLENITDKAVGVVLDAYEKKGALTGTYVIFIADHGQIPTLNDAQHKLGTDDEHSPFGLVAKSGFRVRRPLLTLADLDKDYQALLAYQGFMAYVYLADRSTCPNEHDPCDWIKPPRFHEDVMPVVSAFYEANRTGNPIPSLKGTIDLIFAREPVSADRNAKPYEIFDGQKLVPIREYLKAHPRPDLVGLEERMNGLSAGPHGNRAGDILLLARACTNSPIEERYFFSAVSHYTWHGSACEMDSHIPFILAQQGGSGERMHALMRKTGGESPSGMVLTPLVRALIGK